jgi:hypothetical protein
MIATGVTIVVSTVSGIATATVMGIVTGSGTNGASTNDGKIGATGVIYISTPGPLRVTTTRQRPATATRTARIRIINAPTSDRGRPGIWTFRRSLIALDTERAPRGLNLNL